MKARKTMKKLSFNKSTIANLDAIAMRGVQGGDVTDRCTITCNIKCPIREDTTEPTLQATCEYC